MVISSLRTRGIPVKGLSTGTLGMDVAREKHLVGGTPGVFSRPGVHISSLPVYFVSKHQEPPFLQVFWMETPPGRLGAAWCLHPSCPHQGSWLETLAFSGTVFWH